MTRFDEIYPDLAKEGGVVNSLQLAFRSIASPLEVTGRSMAMVKKNRRLSQIYTAVNERSFGFDFWDRGVLLANATTPDLFEVARYRAIGLLELCQEHDIFPTSRVLVLPPPLTLTPSSEYRLIEDNETEDRQNWIEVKVNGQFVRPLPGSIIIESPGRRTTTT